MNSQITRAAVQSATTLGRPIVSHNAADARKSVLAAYKKWQRSAPGIRDNQHFYDYPMGQFRLMLKEQFMRNKDVVDLRVIDRLVAKAETELFNTNKGYNNPDHLRNYFVRENLESKPQDFLSRFFAGKD